MSNENGSVLGIDLGANSLGTALIDRNAQQIRFTGVRIFAAGVNNLDESKEAPRGVERRMARQQRKQIDRRRRRFHNTFGILQHAGLLPPGPRTPEYFAALDNNLREKFGNPEKLPYAIRAAALDQLLDPFELGRALVHLAQRRGFLSNSKAVEKDEKEAGKVKEGIAELEQNIAAANCRTLGEYFAKHVDPKQRRIRARYTQRKMYQNEFEAIWRAQLSFGSTLLTATLKSRLANAIFFQRPLKSQADKVGRCELEPGCKRAPVALLEVQRFRFLSVLNNLRIVDTDGRNDRLSDVQRAAVLARSETGEKLAFSKLKKPLGLEKNQSFSAESGGAEDLPGVPSAYRLRKALTRAWDDLTPERQRELVEFLVLGAGHPEDQIAHLIAGFEFDEATASAAVATALPQGYYSISLEAIRKMMPLLAAGQSYATARKEIYGEVRRSEPVALLPALNTETVRNLIGDVRNPIVMRSLSELRKTVNAIVRKYGKPEFIHIELARDVRRNADERARLSKRNNDQRKTREAATQHIASVQGIPVGNITRRDVEKYLLAQECGFRCPYSGRTISMEALFGQHALFHIEHVVPYSASMDNSFDNKTLCYHELNAVKRDRTPWEAFGASGDWENIVERVKRWPAPNPRKLRRFLMNETDRAKLLEEFSSRQLNDTRYASRLAALYLGLLYGGTVDADGSKRVFTCSGPVTSILRDVWDLNRILNPASPGKSREDHRHHAVDAAAIALCSQGMVQRLSEAATQAASIGRRRLAPVGEPWPGFREDLEKSVLATNVSLKPEYKLQGAMHDQTLYSRQRPAPDGKKVVHIRKPVTEVKPAEIVDPRVREAVEATIAEVGSAKKLGVDDKWPVLTTRTGKTIPIKRVRVKKSETPVALGHGVKGRWVVPNSVHHTEIVRNESGKKVRFDHHPVSTIEALRRLGAGEPVVRRDFGEKCRFVCSLRSGDLLEFRVSHTPNTLWLVRTVKSNGQIELNPVSDGRKKAEIMDSKLNPTRVFLTQVVNITFAEGARKVLVSHLGEVLAAHD